MNRREFLAAAIAAGLPAHAVAQDSAPRRIPARFVGDALERAHHWITPDPEKLHVDRREKTGVVVVGAGFAGVVAAWRLAMAGYDDFKLLELEDKAGGLARSGVIGNLTVPFGGDEVALFSNHGAWGTLVAAEGSNLVFLTANGQYVLSRRNFDGAWKLDDGFSEAWDFMRRPESRRMGDLETIALSDELRGAGPEPTTYLTQHCLRRFGARPGDVSAAAVYADMRESFPPLLLPPEGPGVLLDAPLRRIGTRLLPARMALHVKETTDGVVVRVVNTRDATVTDIEAKAAILAVPPFAAARITPALRARWADLAIPPNSPWLVSAIQVSRWPSGFDHEASWHHTMDERANTILHAGKPPEAVVLVHRPFPASATTPARMFLRDLEPGDARDWVLRELHPVFPDLAEIATRIEMFRVAHGPIRPAPGFATKVLPVLKQPAGAIHPCGADYSATPNLVHATASGSDAAEAVLRSLDRKFETWR